MEPVVIGIARTADGLEEMVYEEFGAPEYRTPWDVHRVVFRRPLPRESRPELAAAWDALGAVHEYDAATAAHMMTVLHDTVPPADTAPLPAPLPELAGQAAMRRATAAHPRAYRGTRHQPPTPPRPGDPTTVDLRPYLLGGPLNELLARLGEEPGGDPYLQARFRIDGRPLEQWFIAHLLPLLKDCSWRHVTGFQAVARALDLAEDRDLRDSLVGVFLGAGDRPDRALGWWSHVLAREPADRFAAAQIIAGSGVAAVEPVDPEVTSDLLALNLAQQWSFLSGLAGGASLPYLYSGIALGAFSAERPFVPGAGSTDMTEAIESVVGRLDVPANHHGGPPYWRAFLWERCGEQPGMLGFLRSAAFTRLEPGAAYELVRHIAVARRDGRGPAEWAGLEPRLHAVCEADVPAAYRRKFIQTWGLICCEEIDRPGERGIDADALYSAALTLSQRVARPPFTTEAVLDWTFSQLIEAIGPEHAVLTALAAAPDASWQALERGCRRENDALPIGRGLASLARRAPALLVAAFADAPAALVRTAGVLDGVSAELAEQIVAEQTAIFARADAEMPLAELMALIAPVIRAGGPNPIRRALRDHLDGRRRLNTVQIAAHHARIVDHLDQLRLAAIRQATLRHMAAGVGLEQPETPEQLHALQMLDGADENRRQLKRLISAAVDGDDNWRLRHPLTEAWLARHPELVLQTWLTGVQLEGDAGPAGVARLATEADPLEALKLGTYVGSCLGRGGALSASAAAVVLDVNKSVVYARDERGRVIGRQLLAISEARELVCFEVYAADPEPLYPLFRAFDLKLAGALAIPLFDAGAESGDYEIASTLSHYWWDDGAWDPSGAGVTAE